MRVKAVALGVLLAVASVSIALGQSGDLTVTLVRSDAIADNLLGEPAEVEVAIYTPPGYAGSDARYPVLYLLHGIAGSYRDWTEGGYQGLAVHGLLDELIEAGEIPPMIVVMPTAMNRYLGSYYADSPVTGDWARFMTEELVAWVDASYRTIPAPGGRGIAGHSMGGYGAITLAMDHPDVFSAVFSMSPCCLDLVEDLGASNRAWHRALAFDSPDDIDRARNDGDLYALAIMGILSVATPDTAAPPFYVSLPFQLDRQSFLLKAEPAHGRYRDFFPVERVDESESTLEALRGLYIDVGHDDQFTHIAPGARAFSERLAELGVPHVFEVYDGDHRNRMRQRMRTLVLPFFARHLDTPDG